MNMQIQIEFGEPVTELQIPVRQVTATARRLRSMTLGHSRARHGGLMKDFSSNQSSVKAEQFITTIRAVLQK